MSHRHARPLHSLAPAVALLGALLLATPRASADTQIEPVTSLTDAQQRQILDEGQQAYDRGIALLTSDPQTANEAFRSAANRFQLLIDAGVVNGRLFYNLANAQLQAGNLGRAILNYRRAEHLIPGDPRLESNLAYARSMRRSPVAPSGRRALLDHLLGWHRHWPLTTRLWIFTAAYAACWMLLIVRLFRPRARWLAAAGACAAIWISAAASVTVDAGLGYHALDGVLLRDDIIVRKGNGLGFAPRFQQPIHRGEEFRLLEHRGDWFNIELRNGKTGWIPADSAQLLRPAAARFSP